MTSLGCCSSLPGDTCLSDVPRGVTGGGPEPRGVEGTPNSLCQWLSRAGTMAQCARQESQSVAAGMATKSCRASSGSQQGCVWGPGRLREGRAPSASGSLSHSLGFSCWGCRNQLELRKAKGTRCHGCYHSLGRSHWWQEGHRGFGSHWAGTGEFDDQRGERGCFALSGARCSWQCHSAACGRPPLGRRAIPRLGARLLQAARCLWKSLPVAPTPGGWRRRGGSRRCPPSCVCHPVCDLRGQAGSVFGGQLDPEPIPATSASCVGSSHFISRR